MTVFQARRRRPGVSGRGAAGPDRASVDPRVQGVPVAGLVGPTPKSGNTGPNAGASPIRRTLHRADGTVLNADNLPTGVKIGRAVRPLAESPEPYYLPAPAPALDASPLTLLRKSVYLLGEEHGDGTWETRTRAWPHITKLVEREKGFTGQDPTERAGIQKAFGPDPRASALEDMSAYLVAQATLLQNLFGDKNFDVTWQNRKSLELIRETYRQVHIGLEDHIDVAHGWLEHLKQLKDGPEEDSDAARRYQEYMELVKLVRNKTWLAVLQDFAQRKDDLPELADLPDLPDLDLSSLVVETPLITNVETKSQLPTKELPTKELPTKELPTKEPIDTGRGAKTTVTQKSGSTGEQSRPFGLPDPGQRAEIQALLQQIVDAVLALLDTRPTGTFLFASWRKGDDPIPNRSQIQKLSRSGSDRSADVIGVTNPLRESKMAERIAAKGLPLLVKVGDRHCEPLIKRLQAAGRAAVAVRKGTDFDAMLSVINPPE